MTPEQPKRSNERADSYASSLRHLFEDWEDGIPEELVHSDSTNNKRKVRAGWFMAVGGSFRNMQQAASENAITLSPALNDTLNEVCEHIFKSMPQRKTTREDIDLVNAALEKAIKELEQQ